MMVWRRKEGGPRREGEEHSFRSRFFSHESSLFLVWFSFSSSASSGDGGEWGWRGGRRERRMDASFRSHFLSLLLHLYAALHYQKKT